MQLNRGRGMEDMGPTGDPARSLPDDVRLPFRDMRIHDFTGKMSKQRDSLNCIIDTAPSAMGARPEDDKTDGSRHVGINHGFMSHQHARSNAGEDAASHERGIFKGAVWVRDRRERYGVRPIHTGSILAVTHPHDCDRHLSDAAYDDLDEAPTAFVLPHTGFRRVA